MQPQLVLFVCAPLPSRPLVASLNTDFIHSPPAPCPPTDVAKSVSCDNRTASLSWSAVAGAVTYTATLEQLNGRTACCTTSGTSCNIADLPCGEMYVLHVMAEGRTCNSSESDGDILRTGVGRAANIYDTTKLHLSGEKRKLSIYRSQQHKNKPSGMLSQRQF